MIAVVASLVAVLMAVFAVRNPVAFGVASAIVVVAALVVRLIKGFRRRFLHQVEGHRLVERASVRPEVLLLPTAVSLRYQKPALALGAVALLAIYALVRRDIDRAPGGGLLLLLAACLPVWLRGTSISFMAIGAASVVVAASSQDLRRTVESLIDGAGLYLVANVVLYYGFGLRSPSAEIRIGSLESSSTLFVERVFMPLSNNLAIPAVLAAAYLVGAAALLPIKHRLRDLVMAGTAVFVLIAVDGRIAMAAAAVISAVVIVAPRIGMRVVAVAAVLFLLIPFWLPEGSTGNVAPSDLQRTNDAQGSLFNNREGIWSEALQFRQDRASLSEKLIGYGANGPYRSGASQIYGRYLRGAIADPTRVSTHNSVVQQLYDGGWLGAYLLVIAIGLILVRLSWAGHQDPYQLAALAALAAIVISSATEVAIAPGSGADPLWALLIIGAVAPRRQIASTSPTRAAAMPAKPDRGTLAASPSHA